MFLEKEGKLIYSYDGETVCIEAWGERCTACTRDKKSKLYRP